MQNRKDIPIFGFDAIFKEDALIFVMHWPHPVVRLHFNKITSRWEHLQVLKIPQSWIEDVALVAAWPQWSRNFAEAFRLN